MKPSSTLALVATFTFACSSGSPSDDAATSLTGTDTVPNSSDTGGMDNGAPTNSSPGNAPPATVTPLTPPDLNPGPNDSVEPEPSVTNTPVDTSSPGPNGPGTPDASGGSTSMAGAGGEGPSPDGNAGMGGTANGGASGESSAAGAPMGGAATGGSGGETGNEGSCETGTTAGSEVLVIGESFIAATHELTREIERQARANGSLGENETYRDNSISGTTLAGGGNSIPNQYANGVAEGPVRYVLMDGGGNDCLQANNPDGALSAAATLFENMAQNGTEKVLYFFYPDPIGDQFGSLKSCLDSLRPQMKALCDGLTSPRCYWLDLREVWDGHPEYTSDGIHPTTEGSVASGQAIWGAMVEHCVAQ